MNKTSTLVLMAAMVQCLQAQFASADFALDTGTASVRERPAISEQQDPLAVHAAEHPHMPSSAVGAPLHSLICKHADCQMRYDLCSMMVQQLRGADVDSPRMQDMAGMSFDACSAAIEYCSKVEHETDNTGSSCTGASRSLQSFALLFATQFKTFDLAKDVLAGKVVVREFGQFVVQSSPDDTLSVTGSAYPVYPAISQDPLGVPLASEDLWTSDGSILAEDESMVSNAGDAFEPLGAQGDADDLSQELEDSLAMSSLSNEARDPFEATSDGELQAMLEEDPASSLGVGSASSAFDALGSKAVLPEADGVHQSGLRNLGPSPPPMRAVVEGDITDVLFDAQGLGLENYDNMTITGEAVDDSIDADNQLMGAVENRTSEMIAFDQTAEETLAIELGDGEAEEMSLEEPLVLDSGLADIGDDLLIDGPSDFDVEDAGDAGNIESDDDEFFEGMDNEPLEPLSDMGDGVTAPNPKMNVAPEPSNPGLFEGATSLE